MTDRTPNGLRRFKVMGGLAACLATTMALSENYVVGIEDIQYLPLYAWENGKWQGLARDILDAFGKDVGHQFIYKPFPINRLYAEFLEKDTLDFKFPDNPNWKSDKKKSLNIIYSHPVIHTTDGLMVLPDMKSALIDDIRSMSTVMGFTPWPWMDRIQKKKVRVAENIRFEGALEMALVGRVSGAYLNVNVTEWQLKEVFHRPKALVWNDKVPYDPVDFFLSTRKNPKILDLLNEWIKSHHETVQSLNEKWSVTPQAPLQK